MKCSLWIGDQLPVVGNRAVLGMVLALLMLTPARLVRAQADEPAEGAAEAEVPPPGMEEFTETPAPRPVPAVTVLPQAAPDVEPSVVTPVDPDADEGRFRVTVVDGQQLVSVTLHEEPIGDVIRSFTRLANVSIISSVTNLTQVVNATVVEKPWRPTLDALLDQCGLMLIEPTPDLGIYTVVPKPTVEPLVAKTVHLDHAQVTSVVRVLEAVLANQGRGSVTPYPSGNAIVVHTSERAMPELLQIIREIDVPRKQVFIEARFVEMSAGASHRLGLDWSSLDGWGMFLTDPRAVFSRTWQSEMLGRDVHLDPNDVIVPGASGSSGSTSARDVDRWIGQQDQVRAAQTRSWTEPALVSGAVQGFSPDEQRYQRFAAGRAQIGASDMALILRALEGTDGVSVVSNPKIIVANEETAIVDMTTKEPYVEISIKRGTQESPGDEISTRLATIPGRNEPFVGEAFFSYGITLEVTPRVNNASNITVSIAPSISELAGTLATPGATTYPIIRMKKVNTVFTLDDGKTAVIGGLTRTEERDEERGVPYLRNIPLIGRWLFNSTVREKQQTEILIFVTVGIVESDTDDQFIGMPSNAVLYEREPIATRPSVEEVRNLVRARETLVRERTELEDRERALERSQLMEPMGDDDLLDGR